MAETRYGERKMFFFPRDIVRVRKIRFLLEGKSYYTRCVNSIDCCVLKIPNWLTLDRLYVNFYDLLRNDRQFIWTEIGFRYDKIKNTILLFSHIGISWFEKIWKLQNTIYTSYKHCLSKLLKSPQSSTRTHKTNRRSDRTIDHPYPTNHAQNKYRFSFYKSPKYGIRGHN